MKQTASAVRSRDDRHVRQSERTCAFELIYDQAMPKAPAVVDDDIVSGVNLP